MVEAVKSISTTLLASRTKRRSCPRPASIASSRPRRKSSALRKDKGAWKPVTRTPDSASPFRLGEAGHQTVVPGMRSNRIGRARVMVKTPWAKERNTPMATPVSIGRTAINAVVSRARANSVRARR